MKTIEVKHHGSFAKLESFLKRVSKRDEYKVLEYYGRVGVDALERATPVDTGLTASSWFFKIYIGKDKSKISWWNSNVVDGVPIALMIQYGHVLQNGVYIEGRDYINPALRPIFDEMANSVWREVTK